MEKKAWKKYRLWKLIKLGAHWKKCDTLRNQKHTEGRDQFGRRLAI